MTFAERLSSLLSKRGDQAALARAIGVQSSTVSDWCSGSKEPGLSNLIKICEYFGSSIDDLLAPVLANASIKKEPALGLAEDERELLECFRYMDEVQRNALMTVARSYVPAVRKGDASCTTGGRAG